MAKNVQASAPPMEQVPYADTVNNELVFDVDQISQMVVAKISQKVEIYNKQQVDSKINYEKDLIRKRFDEESKQKQQLHDQTLEYNRRIWRLNNQDADQYDLMRKEQIKDAEAKRQMEKNRVERITRAEVEKINELTRSIRLENNKFIYVYKSIGYGLIGSGLGVLFLSSFL